MREIKYIVLHCTATPQTASTESIQKYWREVLGWKSPGYHYIIMPNGALIQLAKESEICNGVAGYNANSIHISYIGGVDGTAPVDNRTAAQKAAQIKLLKTLKGKYPNAIIQGHRDFPNVKKACPSFDVKSWLKSVNL